jgi:hypothetical protein
MYTHLEPYALRPCQSYTLEPLPVTSETTRISFRCCLALCEAYSKHLHAYCVMFDNAFAQIKEALLLLRRKMVKFLNVLKDFAQQYKVRNPLAYLCE